MFGDVFLFPGLVDFIIGLKNLKIVDLGRGIVKHFSFILGVLVRFVDLKCVYLGEGALGESSDG